MEITPLDLRGSLPRFISILVGDQPRWSGLPTIGPHKTQERSPDKQGTKMLLAAIPQGTCSHIVRSSQQNLIWLSPCQVLIRPFFPKGYPLFVSWTFSQPYSHAIPRILLSYPTIKVHFISFLHSHMHCFNLYVLSCFTVRALNLGFFESA